MKPSAVFQFSFLILLFLSFSFPLSAVEQADAKNLFKKKCSLCHALDKKKLGPAVSSMDKNADVLRKTISNGKRPMPAYAGKLTTDQINLLVDYILANQ